MTIFQKHILLCCAGAIVLASCTRKIYGVKPGETPAAILFDSTSCDFGLVKAGKKVSHTFNFTNTGTVPLVIQNIEPACGCTTPQWTKEPLPPGSRGIIEITFDNGGELGKTSKGILVTANTEPIHTYLVFHAEVVK